MFVIVNVGTGLPNFKGHMKVVYRTQRGAKTACTKLNKSYIGNPLDAVTNPQWKVTDYDEYMSGRTVKMVERTNLMSGEKFMEPEDTPYYCSPSSESYWSN